MKIPAMVTSKGQVTIPAHVRRALGIHAGDTLLFQLEAKHARLEKVPDFFDLAGSVPVPAALKSMSGEEIMRLEKQAWEHSVSRKRP